MMACGLCLMPILCLQTHVVVAEQQANDPENWCKFIGHVNDAMGNGSLLDIAPPRIPGLASLKERLNSVVYKAQVTMDIIAHLEWKQFLILYDLDYERQVKSMVDVWSTIGLTSQLASTQDLVLLKTILLQYFEESKEFHIVMVTSYKSSQKVIQMTETLESDIGKRISVTGKSSWLIFSQRDRVNSRSWMFMSRFDNVAVISDTCYFQQRGALQFDASDTMLVTTLLYKTGRRELSPVGTVDHRWTLQLTSEIFPNIRFGFNGRLFVVTTNTWAPYVYRREGQGGSEYYGLCMDLADELARTLNFTIQWTEPADGNWGADDGNGSWNGLVGQIQRQEVDMIIAPIGVTAERERVIDFTFAFFYDDSAVILKKPDPVKSKWRTYIDIFRKEVLFCITGALVVGAAIILAIERLTQRLDGSGNKVFAHTYVGSFLYLLGAMLAQGGRNLPTSRAGRVFLSCWWLFCLVIAGTYSGNLIAVLTVSKDKPPFNTLEEMANQDEYKFGTLGQSMWTTLFKTSSRPEFQAIFNKMESYVVDNPDIYNTDPQVHLEMVKKGGYAYIADKGLFSNWLAYNCDLMLLKEKFFPGKYAIGLPNKSVYTKIFSDQVVKIYESGLLQIWIKKWWPKRSFCGGSLITQAKALSLIDVQSVFYVIGIGFALGGIILAVERFLYLVQK